MQVFPAIRYQHFPLTHPLQIFFIYTRHSLWKSRHVKQFYLLTNEIVAEILLYRTVSVSLVFSPQDERAATAETGKGNAKKLLRNEEQIEEIKTHPDTKSSGKHNMPQIV